MSLPISQSKSNVMSANVGNGLNQDSLLELADLVRMMNSYYSNLIEGHNTRPLDIEKALTGLQIEPEKRPLALEAKAHVEVQRAIDAAHRTNKLTIPVSTTFISWVHRSFYDEMPSEFRVTKRQDGREISIVPGKLRSSPEEDIAVGRHMPPSSSVVRTFMDYFETRFTAAEGKASLGIIAIATAHHRLNYIHPFVDGNGRVSRLMSHAMGLRAGIGGAGLWSISRGLARGLRDRGEYKRYMDSADSPRRGDRDGRGNLSEAALIEFSEWFLSVMLDQIRFSKAIFQLDKIQERYKDLLAGLKLETRAIDLVMSIFKFGQNGARRCRARAEDARAHGPHGGFETDRAEILKSSTPKGPVRVLSPWSTANAFFRTCSLKEKSTRPNRRSCSSAAEDGRGLDRSKDVPEFPCTDRVRNGQFEAIVYSAGCAPARLAASAVNGGVDAESRTVSCHRCLEFRAEHRNRVACVVIDIRLAPHFEEWI